MFDRGLIYRAEDRSQPIIKLALPLIAGEAEFSTITRILREVLGEAWSVWKANGR